MRDHNFFRRSLDAQEFCSGGMAVHDGPLSGVAGDPSLAQGFAMGTSRGGPLSRGIKINYSS